MPKAALLVLLSIMAACSRIEGDPGREVQADGVIAMTIAGDTDGVLAGMSPELDRSTGQVQLTKLRTILPRTAPPPGKTIGFNRLLTPGGKQYTITRQYDFPAAVVVTQTQMAKTPGGRWIVLNFNSNTATREQLKANDFSLSGKTPIHYAVLASMVIVVGLIATTVGFALRRRRWGWAVFALFGFVGFQLNWTTGASGVQPLQFYILGAGFMRAASPFAPWVFSVSLPVGAVLFWALRKNTHKPPKKRMSAAESYISTPDDLTPPETPPRST